MAYSVGGPSGQWVNVTPGASAIRGDKVFFDYLRVGGAGNVEVTLPDGSDITITGAVAGEYIPVRGSHVLSGSTTATNISAIFPDHAGYAG